MVLERKVLRTYALALIRRDKLGEQKRSIERWVQVHSVKLEHTFDRVDRLLEELSHGTWTIDYVLVHSPECLSKSETTVRRIQQQCRAGGAQVVYTSR